MRVNTFPIVLVTALLSITACKKEGEQAHMGPGGGMPPAAVDTVTVQPQKLESTKEYAGRTQGSREVEVRARVQGILIERSYAEGSTVNKGDVLFMIDTAPYQVALQRAIAQQEQARARLLSAQRNYDRIIKLFDKKAVSERQRDDALSELDVAKANLSSAEAEVNAAQINMGYTSVVAPISGITSREAVSEGSLVGPGANDSLLTRITQLDPIYVMFAYADSDFIRQRESLSQGNISADLVMNDGSVYNQKGSINFMDTFIDRDTGTVQARATFPNPDGKILPGQFVRVRPAGLVRDNAIVIPEKAVMQGPQGKFVYKVDDKGTAQVVPVETGYSNAGQTVIESGLAPNDKIIVDGVIRVMPGAPVQTGEQKESAAQSGEGK